MEFYQYLLDKYGYDEPILTEQLKEELKLNPNTLRQYIKRLSDKGSLTKVQNGIYFIPKKKPIFGSAVLDTDQIIRKKFLVNHSDIIGYKSGTNFANALGLTSQTAAVETLVTNKASAAKREVNVYKRRFIIRKPRVSVNKSNYKLLQVLDLLNNYEQYSEKPLEAAREKILMYLEGISMNESQVKEYLNAYPIKTKLKVYELGLFDAVARRERAVQ